MVDCEIDAGLGDECVRVHTASGVFRLLICVYKRKGNGYGIDYSVVAEYIRSVALLGKSQKARRNEVTPPSCC